MSPGDVDVRAKRVKRTLRSVLLCAIGVLYVLSVPWYRGTDAPVELALGLPDWVAVALACYIGVAVLNGIAWLLTDVPERMPDSSEESVEDRAADRPTGDA